VKLIAQNAKCITLCCNAKLTTWNATSSNCNNVKQTQALQDDKTQNLHNVLAWQQQKSSCA
jgi:hypothetical protein